MNRKLNGSGKIHRVKASSIWEDDRTLFAQALAYEGFTYNVMVRYTELTKGQLGYRLRHLGVSPKLYRQGEGEKAVEVLRKLKRQFLTSGGK